MARNNRQKPRGGAPSGNANALKHGMYSAQSIARNLRRVKFGKLVDRRSSVGRALHAWRRSLVEDLGGMDNLSAQQLQLVDLACRDRLILDTIDGFLFQQKTLVNARKRTVHPIVVQRMKIADALARRLSDLGLERKSGLIDYESIRAEYERKGAGGTK